MIKQKFISIGKELLQNTTLASAKVLSNTTLTTLTSLTSASAQFLLINSTMPNSSTLTSVQPVQFLLINSAISNSLVTSSLNVCEDNFNNQNIGGFER